MGDLARMMNYESNTELDQENILVNCLERAYGKDTKAQLLDQLIEKITEEIWQNSDSEVGDNQVFYWVMNYGNKKEIDHSNDITFENEVKKPEIKQTVSETKSETK